MAEIKAAAERVRRVRACHPRHHVYPWWSATSTYDDDCERLADAYLAEHQADDDEPITDKWLSTIYDAIAIEGITFGVLVMNTIDNIRTKLMVTMTRGQVRSLLRAMGVTK